MAYEKLTVSTAAVGLTAAVYEPLNKFPVKAVLRVETADIRFRLDGIAPTSTDGIALRAEEVLELSDYDEVAGFRAIRAASTDATLHVQYVEE